MDNSPLLVLATCPEEVAEEIAKTLVEDRHAACVNILPGVQSVYRWNGELQRDSERLLLAKTVKESYRGLEETIQRLHPYELPEIIAVPIVAGLSDYLHWATLQTQKDL